MPGRRRLLRGLLHVQLNGVRVHHAIDQRRQDLDLLARLEVVDLGFEETPGGLRPLHGAAELSRSTGVRGKRSSVSQIVVNVLNQSFLTFSLSRLP